MRMILTPPPAYCAFLPAEAVPSRHHRADRYGQAVPAMPAADNARLQVTALGLSFPNPVGLAAGFDKNAQVSAAMGKLGFGFVECGRHAQAAAGNPRPRLFRLREDRAVIKPLGFNNDGMEKAAAIWRGGGLINRNGALPASISAPTRTARTDR